MMSEFLCGRLEIEQREVFETHLLECSECREKLKGRKNLLSAMKPTLEDKDFKK